MRSPAPPSTSPATSFDRVTPQSHASGRYERFQFAYSSSSKQRIIGSSETRNAQGTGELAKEEQAAALLYDAQLDLIAHKTFDAIAKLEASADLGSSAACSTLGNLLARRWRDDVLAPPARSPPTPGSSSTLRKDTSSPDQRPALQSRQGSTWTATRHPPHSHSDVLKATSLFIRGLEIDLLKPTLSPSSYLAASPTSSVDYDSDEQDGETSCFSLERALDLLIGIADSHRFGILHAPEAACSHESTDSGAEQSNDGMWRAAAECCSAVLVRPEISTVLYNGDDASALTETWLRCHGNARADSPVGAHRLRNRGGDVYKRQCAIAIVALYVLALQAWSSSLPSTSCSPPGSPPSESVHTAQRYWRTICTLADQCKGGLGTKAVDELVERARYRLEATHRPDLGASEPWRTAKKRGRIGVGASPSQALAEQQDDDPPAHVSPGLRLLSTQTDQRGEQDESRTKPEESSIGEHMSARTAPRAPRFHFGSEDETPPERERPQLSLLAVSTSSPPVPLVPPPASSSSAASARSPTHVDKAEYSATSPSSHARSRAGNGVEYPPASHHQDGSPQKGDAAAAASTRFARTTAHSSTAAVGSGLPTLSPLPRNGSMQSFQSFRSNASALSSFRHNPLQQYLEGRLLRVPSSVSVCTAPPDFANPGSRIRFGKGKARALAPAGVQDAARGTTATPAADTAASDAAARKTWLSRFWQTSAVPRRTVSYDQQAALSVGDRSRSHTALEHLRRTLDRHEAARGVAIDYWGETEFLEDDDEDAGEALETLTDSVASPPPGDTHQALSSRAQRLQDNLGATQHFGREHRRRTGSGHRAFALTDPTASSAASSREPSRDRDVRSPADDRQVDSPPNHPAGTKSSRHQHHRSAAAKRDVPTAVAMDPLLMELERHSRVGVKTVCAACGKKGLNFPACRRCRLTYCGRECRTSPKHEALDEAAQSVAVSSEDSMT
ncbi:hypothetical protein JCM10908_006954 [Rhodotorula pacifica]|uniref:zinc finger MYND domain-containing protein n=1 Tax=Rhodotorula pacifica TaxID=1495444 RepID=UPI00316EC32E